MGESNLRGRNHGEMSHGVVFGHMIVSAVVVVCQPESRASLIERIEALPWAEVRHTDEGRMVVVVEAADTEQSMEEAFSQFRERVREEIDDSDFRTHYDLAIGYKEMGLISEAISEFEIASTSEELRCEACVMLAVCHRDQGDTVAAESWYRKAIAAAAGDAEASNALRYELAEVLVD